MIRDKIRRLARRRHLIQAREFLAEVRAAREIGTLGIEITVPEAGVPTTMTIELFLLTMAADYRQMAREA